MQHGASGHLCRGTESVPSPRLQVSLDLGGYAVVVSDTAGIRESSDVVEQEGVKRALERAQRADIRVFVFDVKVRAVF